MKPNEEYSGFGKDFWAHVRLISEQLGYSDKKVKTLRRYSLQNIIESMELNELNYGHLIDKEGNPSDYCGKLLRYLNYRSDILERQVEPNLMNREQAKEMFERLRDELNPTCKLPMNKQKKEKHHHAFMVCMVNMLTENTLGGLSFDDSPRGLTIITKNGKPLRTFARWMDGAYPSIINPKAVWEVKEYYGTTTFGSRVADGVYETLLDGEEIFELYKSENIKILHYLMVDDHYTWWDCGRSYLCRIIDMLHMNLLDEVLFGKEVLTRWPIIVRGWID